MWVTATTTSSSLNPSQVKNAVVKHYVEKVIAPADDPIPGNRYSDHNVRKWYDNGNILPLVVLRQAFRSPNSSPLSSLDISLDRSTYSLEVKSEELTSGSSSLSSDADQQSKSVYSQESTDERATHDNDDISSICSEASSCDTYTSASGAFLPAEEQENVSPCQKRLSIVSSTSSITFLQIMN
jgi:hypothetical protein